MRLELVAITVNSTGALGGSGFGTSPVLVNLGGHLSAGGPLGTRTGTLNLGGPVTLATGSILDVDLTSTTGPNDLINFFGSGSLLLTGGVNSVGVNVVNAGLTSAYFFNGTYNVFTGIPASSSANLSSTISALHTINEDTTGTATFVFSVIGNGAAPARVLLTVAPVAGATGNWTNRRQHQHLD